MFSPLSVTKIIEISAYSDIRGVYIDYLYCEVRSYIYILDVLSPFSEEIIEISGCSDIWGVYFDNLICRVSSYIHTRCSASFYVREIYF